MKSIAASILGLLIGLMPAPGLGQTLPRITDPIFGLTYDSARIKFEGAADVVMRCPELVNERWGRRVFLFARSVELSGTYVVLGGLYERRAPPAKGEKRFEADPKGVLLREHEFESRTDRAGARGVRISRGWRHRGDIALARTRCRRPLRQAFGGRPEFLAALAGAKKRADLTNARATILREAVQQIGR